MMSRLNYTGVPKHAIGAARIRNGPKGNKGNPLNQLGTNPACAHICVISVVESGLPSRGVNAEIRVFFVSVTNNYPHVLVVLLPHGSHSYICPCTKIIVLRKVACTYQYAAYYITPVIN